MTPKLHTFSYKIKHHLRRLGAHLKIGEYRDPGAKQRASVYGYNRYKDALLQWSKTVLDRYKKNRDRNREPI